MLKFQSLFHMIEILIQAILGRNHVAEVRNDAILEKTFIFCGRIGIIWSKERMTIKCGNQIQINVTLSCIYANLLFRQDHMFLIWCSHI